jgi:signal transduction histidine kinase
LTGSVLRNAAQLIKNHISRRVTSYVYLGLLATVICLVNATEASYSASHPDELLVVLYLVSAAVLLNLTVVRLERGHLTLAGVAIGTAAIVTNPLDATIIGLAIPIGLASGGTWRLIGNAIIYGSVTSTGALVAAELPGAGDLSLWERVAVLMTVNVATFALVSSALALRSGESVANVVRQNLHLSFYATFGYFTLAALLISYVLDGSLLGYFLATIVCVLALALTDTIAGRRVRRVLESELSDADRHLFHSRAVEGVVHNLRNHMANALGYLKEIDSRRLDPVDRDSLETATSAAQDAVTVLRSLSQGATPRVSYSAEPVDLNELVNRALGMARPRARTKEVQLAMRESPESVAVRADPLLLREVITNLLNNAIDAAPSGGEVEAIVGRRSNGWPYVSVIDNGPGVLEDQRHHLFEPHFTTKEGGTGLGLFMSYGIVREHHGQLLFEGNRRGAIFTVTLPPAGG